MKNYKEELKELRKSISLIIIIAIAAYIVLNAESLLGKVGNFLSYFDTLFVGIAIAYVLNILMCYFEKKFQAIKNDKNFFKTHARSVGLVLAIIIVVVLVVLILTMIVPELVKSVLNIVQSLPTYVNNLVAFANDILTKLHMETIKDIDASSIENLLKQFGLDYNTILNTLSNWVFSSDVINTVSGLASGFINFFVSVMIAIYLLIEKEYFINGTKKVGLALFGEELNEKVLSILRDGNQIMHDFIGGKGVECVVVGILVYVPMLVFNIEYSSICGVVCGFFTIIPVFGSIIATIICGLLLLSVNPLGALIFIVIYQVVQFLDGNLIYPKFISKSLGLSPVWILTSVTVGGSIFGFIGFIIAVPLASILYLLFTRYINKKIADRKVNI